jgi:hypothetical protein
VYFTRSYGLANVFPYISHVALVRVVIFVAAITDIELYDESIKLSGKSEDKGISEAHKSVNLNSHTEFSGP